MWDPHTKDKTHKVEMVQRHVAPWILRGYARMASVTSLQSQLNWQILEMRHSVACLSIQAPVIKLSQPNNE